MALWDIEELKHYGKWLLIIAILFIGLLAVLSIRNDEPVERTDPTPAGSIVIEGATLDDLPLQRTIDGKELQYGRN